LKKTFRSKGRKITFYSDRPKRKIRHKRYKLKKEFYVLVFFTCTFLMGLMLHNIDLAFNMDSNCIDINALGIIQDKTTMYVRSFTGIIILIIFQILSFVKILFTKE